MIKRSVLLFSLSLIIAGLLVGKADFAATPKKGIFTGSVRDSSGRKLNGIFVSAAREAGTYTVTVYTNDDGQFRFPELTSGTYKVTAHSAGFRPSGRVAGILDSNPVVLDFFLQVEDRPSELVKQATSSEWLSSLPGTIAQKYSLSKNCGSCHHNLFQIRERHFTEPDWATIVSVMERIDVIGELGFQESDKYYLPWRYGTKEQIAAYLAQVQGPQPQVPNIQFYPRPSGPVTQAVITEYRIPRGNAIPHDVQVDAQGNVWYNDFKADYLGRLDPKTGQFKEYKLPTKPGPHPGSQDMFIGEDKNVWVHQRLSNRTVRFDPKTEQVTGIWDNTHFDRVSVQRGLALGTSMKLDLKTGQVYRYKFTSSTAGYGTAVDSSGIGFRGGIADSDIKVLDPETGKVTNYRTPTPDSGPRRITLDGDDYLWFGEWFGGNIGQLDIKSGKIVEYSVSVPFAAFYEAGVDPQNHIGWSFDWRNDRLDRVDPRTGQVMEFPMPTLDVEGRRTAVDVSTTPPSVWINGAGNGLIIRLQSP